MQQCQEYLVFVFSVINYTPFIPRSSQLFYKNGQPFPAHRPVGLRVNITHIELALDIPVTQEVLHEPESNVVKVAFTVRKAGRYEVAVKLGGLNVAYSPYYKIFQPGITTTSVWDPTQILQSDLTSSYHRLFFYSFAHCRYSCPIQNQDSLPFLHLGANKWTAAHFADWAQGRVWKPHQ